MDSVEKEAKKQLRIIQTETKKKLETIGLSNFKFSIQSNYKIKPHENQSLKLDLGQLAAYFREFGNTEMEKTVQSFYHCICMKDVWSTGYKLDFLVVFNEPSKSLILEQNATFDEHFTRLSDAEWEVQFTKTALKLGLAASVKAAKLKKAFQPESRLFDIYSPIMKEGNKMLVHKREILSSFLKEMVIEQMNEAHIALGEFDYDRSKSLQNLV